jgi:hypothetical protein
MTKKTKRSLSLALSMGVAVAGGACGKLAKDENKDPDQSSTTNNKTSSGDPNTTQKSGGIQVPVTIATVGAPRAPRLNLAAPPPAAPPVPATVAAFRLKLGSDKKLSAQGPAVATSKVDPQTGKAALKLAPGYYEIVTRNASGGEDRSTIMQVVPPPPGKAPKPQVVQVDKNTPVARALGKKVIAQDPDLFAKSGLNLSLVFTQAKNLSDVAKKKNKTVADKDINVTANAIAKETKKKASSINTKAAAKKLYLQDPATPPVADEEPLDAYGILLSQIHEQSMDPEVAAKFSTEEFDPRRLFNAAENKLGTLNVVDPDVFKDARELDSDNIGRALVALSAELSAEDKPEFLGEILQEIALDEMLDKLEGSDAVRAMTPEQFGQLMATLEVELSSRDETSMANIFEEFKDEDVDANTSDPLLQIIAKAEDGADATAINGEMAEVQATFSAEEASRLAAEATENKAEESENRDAEAGAGEEAQEAQNTTEQPVTE